MEPFEPQSQKQHSRTAYINVVCFFLMILFGWSGSMLPMFSYSQNIFWEIANACFITACVLTSVQLADKKWLIAAAGYILMSISFIGFFSLIPTNTFEKIQEVAKNVIIILPAMLMINSYTPFPLWLKFLGLIACVPFIAVLILSQLQMELMSFELIFGIGYFLIQSTALCWGIFFLLSHRKLSK